MKNKEIENLIKSIDIKTCPPEGLKEKILSEIMYKPKALLPPFAKFIFEKPLRTAFAAGLAVSGALWAVMGKSFSDFLGSIIG